MGAGAEAALAVVLRLRNQMQEELGGVRSQLQAFARDAAMVGGTLTAGVSLPLLAIARDAINVASTFESQMNVLTVAARSSGTSLNELSRAALLVGKDTQLVGINSQEAANAMTNFYKAGLSTSDIFGGKLNNYLAEGTNLTGALRSAIDLAAASELDLSAASMLVASSMATFGLSAGDAGRIANAFVGAADASLASVNDLALAMQNIGPTAAAFGWSLEETNTALALLSTRGIMGAEAGTALKSMMTNLMSGTKETTAALNALNVSLFDQQGNMLPLPAIIGQLRQAMAGMTEEQRLGYIQTLAGTYGMKALNTLLAEGVGGWDAMAQAIAAAATAQEVGAARTQGLQAAWEQMRGAIETVYIQVGLPLIQNFLTPLVQRITEVISSIMTLNPQVLNAALAFAGVLAVGGPVVLALSGVAAVLGALLSPIGLVVLAVAGLAAAWATDFGGIREITGTVLTAVGSTVETVVGGIRDFVASSVGATRESWSGAWTAIQGIVESVLGVIRAAVGSVLDGVRGFIAANGADIEATLGSAWHSISEIVRLALTLISTSVGNILGAVRGLVAGHGDAIQTILTGAWTVIKAVITTALGVIQGTLTAVLRAAQGDWSGAWTAIKNVAQTIWEGIKGLIGGTLTVILGLVGTNLGQVRAFFESTFNGIRSFLQGIDLGAIGSAMIAGLIGGIRSMAGALVAAARGVVQSAIEAAKSLLGIHSPSKVFYRMGEETDAGYIGGVDAGADAVMAATRNMAQGAIEAANAVAKRFAGVGESAVAAMAAGMGTAAPELGEAATRVMGQATDAVSGALELLNGLVTEVRLPNVGEAINRISRFLTTLVGNLAAWAASVSGEAQTAAKAFAESAGPVVSAFNGALELLKGLATETRVPAAGEGINRISRFLTTLVGNLAEWALSVGAEAQTAAKAFAENAKPVEEAYTSALKLLAELATETRVPAAGEGINRISRFLTTLVGNLAEWAKTVSIDALLRAQAFALAAQDVIKLFGDALDSLTKLVGVDFSSLKMSAYEAGFGWITGLADGIRGGMDYLVAALAAVGDMFPHSPAKAGPLRRAPDWAAYLNFGLIDAATQVAGVLSGVGGGMTVAPVGVSRASSVTPTPSVVSRASSVMPVRGGNGAPVVINFTYAPAVSLASEREAQEVIAPMLRTVMAREGRR